MNIFLAFIPFLVAFVMIAFLHQSVQRTGIVTLVITYVVILLTPIFHLVPTFFFSAFGGYLLLISALFVEVFVPFSRGISSLYVDIFPGVFVGVIIVLCLFIGAIWK